MLSFTSMRYLDATEKFLMSWNEHCDRLLGCVTFGVPKASFVWIPSDGLECVWWGDNLYCGRIYITHHTLQRELALWRLKTSHWTTFQFGKMTHTTGAPFSIIISTPVLTPQTVLSGGWSLCQMRIPVTRNGMILLPNLLDCIMGVKRITYQKVEKALQNYSKVALWCLDSITASLMAWLSCISLPNLQMWWTLYFSQCPSPWNNTPSTSPWRNACRGCLNESGISGKQSTGVSLQSHRAHQIGTSLVSHT